MADLAASTVRSGVDFVLPVPCRIAARIGLAPLYGFEAAGHVLDLGKDALNVAGDVRYFIFEAFCIDGLRGFCAAAP